MTVLSIASHSYCYLLLLSIGFESIGAWKRPDCNQQGIIRNLDNLCKSYPYLKRSTHNDFVPEGMGKEVGQWISRFMTASLHPNMYYNNVKEDTTFQHFGWKLFYPSQQGSQGQDQVQSKQEDLENLFNPIYYQGDEVQARLERWRRNKALEIEIRKFVRFECCVSGCPFPSAYLEFDKRTNICNIR